MSKKLILVHLQTFSTFVYKHDIGINDTSFYFLSRTSPGIPIFLIFTNPWSLDKHKNINLSFNAT